MMALKENLMDVIYELSKEKGIDREELIKIVEEAIIAAARKKLTKYHTIEAELNQKTGQIELFQYKRVSQFPTDPENEILLEEAQAMDESAEEGDEVEYEIEQKEFLRIAQSARQLIFKRIKEAEREMIFNRFSERKGEILTGTVIRTEHGGRIAIDFNKTEAYLFKREQIMGERFDAGDHIRVYLMDVTNDSKQPSQLIISRTHPGFLMKLFEMEVPEVYDGIVEIINASREPGKRAKVSVHTNESDVDPVGACVGMRGSRVQSIVSELRGEKIDIVRWNEELPVYLENAMAPAEIVQIEIDDEQREINIWVEQDQLSLAIGRQGQNVRLASKLIGYKINVSPLEERTGISIEDQIALELEKGRSHAEGIPSQENIVSQPTEATLPHPDDVAETPEEGAPQEAPIAEENTVSQEIETIEENTVEEEANSAIAESVAEATQANTPPEEASSKSVESTEEMTTPATTESVAENDAVKENPETPTATKSERNIEEIVEDK